MSKNYAERKREEALKIEERIVGLINKDIALLEQSAEVSKKTATGKLLIKPYDAGNLQKLVSSLAKMDEVTREERKSPSSVSSDEEFLGATLAEIVKSEEGIVKKKLAEMMDGKF